MKEFEKYPFAWIILQNFAIIAMFVIGFIGMLPVKLKHIPVVSISYAMFIIVLIGFVLRKHLCTNCYYYDKLCSTGWGKLSALLFKKISGNYNKGVKLARITWTLIMLIPVIIMILVKNLKLLSLFVFIGFLNLVIHKQACKRCKMKKICPLA